LHRILSSSLSHTGRKRANNEDFIASFEPTDPDEQEASGSLYVVADGVGGAALGERASRYAVEKLLYDYYQHADTEIGERLRRIIELVNEDIYSFACQSSEITRMGTTLVAAAIRGDLLTVANVGDSRAYLIRDGMATQITRDHNLIGDLVYNGSMTEAEALSANVKNHLTRALGSEEDIRVDIFPSIQLLPGDKLLLCTDGLTRYAQKEDIARLSQDGSTVGIAEGLVQFANELGGADNVSVIAVAFEPGLDEQPGARVQKTPMPVSWDDMETEPVVTVVRRKRLRSPIFWVLMGLGALLLIGALIFGLPKLVNLINENPAKCEYTVLVDETINQIFNKLNREPPYNGISCATSEPGNQACAYNPSNPDGIDPGWILVIENVEKEDCQSNNGIFIPAP
jgi:serine/threonine protein phosphatase PrpC